MNPRFTILREVTRMTITFDDGGMNLLSSDALHELGAVIRAIESPRVIVFRSGRERLFAAGADMKEMAGFDSREAEEFSRLGQELFAAIEKLPFITVAQIDGDCFGGALDLAMAFDVRFATPRSRFSHPGAKIGIVTGFGGTSRWRRLLSRQAANALFIGNRAFTASEALDAGLCDAVNESFEEEIERFETLDPREVRLVKELTRCAPALTRTQLRLFGGRLAKLYFG